MKHVSLLAIFFALTTLLPGQAQAASFFGFLRSCVEYLEPKAAVEQSEKRLLSAKAEAWSQILDAYAVEYSVQELDGYRALVIAPKRGLSRWNSYAQALSEHFDGLKVSFSPDELVHYGIEGGYFSHSHRLSLGLRSFEHGPADSSVMHNLYFGMLNAQMRQGVDNIFHGELTYHDPDPRALVKSSASSDILRNKLSLANLPAHAMDLHSRILELKRVASPQAREKLLVELRQQADTWHNMALRLRESLHQALKRTNFMREEAVSLVGMMPYGSSVTHLYADIDLGDGLKLSLIFADSQWYERFKKGEDLLPEVKKRLEVLERLADANVKLSQGLSAQTTAVEDLLALTEEALTIARKTKESVK